jgi:hypothetical protein
LPPELKRWRTGSPGPSAVEAASGAEPSKRAKPASVKRLGSPISTIAAAIVDPVAVAIVEVREALELTRLRRLAVGVSGDTSLGCPLARTTPDPVEEQATLELAALLDIAHDGDHVRTYSARACRAMSCSGVSCRFLAAARIALRTRSVTAPAAARGDGRGA